MIYGTTGGDRTGGQFTSPTTFHHFATRSSGGTTPTTRSSSRALRGPRDDNLTPAGAGASMAACLALSATRLRTPTAARSRSLFAVMGGMGLCGVLVYCHCGQHVALSADHWRDDLRLSALEPRFICQGCGSRGADVRPDFNWNQPMVRAMGYENDETKKPRTMPGL